MFNSIYTRSKLEMNKKVREPKDSLREWRWKNFKNVLSNVRYRIIFPIFFLIVATVLVFISVGLVELYISWIVNQILIVVLLFFPLIWSAFYTFRSLTQVLQELILTKSIYRVRKDIKKVISQKGASDFRSLQTNMNRVRTDLKYFIEWSATLTPPISDYELDRLQRAIDIFFNTASEVLFPTPFVFSRAERIERERTLDYYSSQEHPTKEEIDEQLQEMEYAEGGIINWFDFMALDEFLNYLGDILFSPTKPYSAFHSKHPVNVILLSKFFKYWNLVISSCKNSRIVYKKVEQDIERYHSDIEKRETQRRQRMSELKDKVLIVIISVIVSTIVNLSVKG